MINTQRQRKGSRMEKAVQQLSKKLEEYNHSKPEQLSLFEVAENPQNQKYSNTIELYDAIPKYFWGGVTRNQGQYIDPIERKFVHKNNEYTVYVQPAKLKNDDGKYIDYLPGQREELVEDVLRKIASAGHGVFLDDQAGVMFTLYEVKKELERMGHGYNLSEIKDAILICGLAVMHVQSKDGKTLVTMPFFETVGLQTQEDWKGHGQKTKAFVRFNPLVTKSIKEGTFRLLDYEKSMSYNRVLARWLHKRMSHNFIQASHTEHYTITLATIIRDSGIKEYPKISDNIIQIKEALDDMVEKETIMSYTIEKERDGRKIIGAKFILKPHYSFIKDIKYGNALQSKFREAEQIRIHKKKYGMI